MNSNFQNIFHENFTTTWTLDKVKNGYNIRLPVPQIPLKLGSSLSINCSFFEPFIAVNYQKSIRYKCFLDPVTKEPKYDQDLLYSTFLKCDACLGERKKAPKTGDDDDVHSFAHVADFLPRVGKIFQILSTVLLVFAIGIMIYLRRVRLLLRNKIHINLMLSFVIWNCGIWTMTYLTNKSSDHNSELFQQRMKIKLLTPFITKPRDLQNDSTLNTVKNLCEEDVSSLYKNISFTACRFSNAFNNYAVLCNISWL